MASPKKDGGFLTQEQREKLRIAVQNAETLSLASPRSPTGGTTSALLQQYEQQLEQKRAAAAAAAASRGGGGGGGGGPRHVRRSHSGKTIKVKKGEALVPRGSTTRSASAMFGSFVIAGWVVIELAVLDYLGNHCCGAIVSCCCFHGCFDCSVMRYVVGGNVAYCLWSSECRFRSYLMYICSAFIWKEICPRIYLVENLPLASLAFC